jgi:hypothetical protein
MLARFQLLDILVKLAVSKYKADESCQQLNSKMVQKLMRENVLAHAAYHNAEEWRW